MLQPRFDKLLAAQVDGISEADRAKARAIAAPIAHALLIERCEMSVGARPRAGYVLHGIRLVQPSDVPRAGFKSCSGMEHTF